MLQICALENCTGCAACLNICKHSAIVMKPDRYGFYHPVIDNEKCVDCELCSKVCPSNHPIDILYPKECYAVVCKEKEELRKVSSGGMASILSEYVISKGGIVYGASGANIREVRHIRIERLEDIDSIRGSKYVQSYIGNTYKYVKQDLKKDKLVLFTGTPCQVAGLRAYLHNKVYENLITADLICHGVPSQQMLNENIDSYIPEKTQKLEVAFRIKPIQLKNNADRSQGIDFGFNIKSQGITYCFFWGGAHASENNQWEIRKSINDDPYMLGFWRNLTFRPCCYNCRYACAARCGDFTIGDFWGLGDDTGLDRDNGVSLALLNTDKAKELWTEISESCDYVRRDIVEAIKGNDQLQRPSNKPIGYEEFRNLYPNTPFCEAVYSSSKQYFKQIKIQKYKDLIRKILHLH